MESLLAEHCADAVQRARLAAYGALLLERGRAVNLTAARDEAAVASHIVDALSIAPYVRGPLVDVGSGAGLPGIPLAIVCGVRVTLIESIGKKARFLEEAVAQLAVDGEVCSIRAEDAARDACYRERFATATARAVGSLGTVLELTLPLLAVGGQAVLQRGPVSRGERDEASAVASLLGGAFTCEANAGGDRVVMVVEKRAATPDAYPRRAGMPKKRPLRTLPGRPAA